MLASLRQVTFANNGPESLILWINRIQEALWLLVILLVPLIYFGRDFAAGSSVLGSFELPKIVLLRTFVGLMVVLWLVEWGLSSSSRNYSTPQERSLDISPSSLLIALRAWLQVSPTRWLTLAVAIFLGSTLLSTVLSGSFSVSLWGETPGQDSYSAYTAVAYVFLFAVISTHLKTPSQLWRLMGAFVAMGVLVAGYSVLQYYGHDFLNLREPITTLRSTSTLSNSILAGSVMLMAITVSFVGATITMRGATGSAWLWTKLSLWGLVLGVQVLGMLFTFSRGPWVGTILAALLIIVLLAAFRHWRILVRALLVVAIAVGASWIIAFVIPKLGGDEREVTPSAAGERATSAITSIVSETTSIIGPTGGVQAGGLGARIQIWKESWGLMTGNPWFGFDSLGLSFLRSLVGYGPDFFRATHLLVAPAGNGGLISEFVHAHNYFVHQGVELGFLGLASSLGIFAAALLVGAHQLSWGRKTHSTIHRLVLIGVLAAVVGRLLEQMVGIARVSDLTLIWVLLAVLAALPAIMRSTDMPSTEGSPDGGNLQKASGIQNSQHVPNSSSRRRRNRRQKTTNADEGQLNQDQRWQALGRLALIILLVIGIGILSWIKGINYVRASVIADRAQTQFQAGDLQTALSSLDRSIDLAPEVSTYYEKRASIYALIRSRGLWSLYPKCGFLAEEVTRDRCMADEAHASNLKWVENRPLYHKARLAAANSYLRLAIIDNNSSLAGESISLYQEAAGMLPDSFHALNLLADASILVGQPQQALDVLKKSLAMVDNPADSFTALLLQAEAFHNLGQTQQSLDSLSKAIVANPRNSEPYFIRGGTYRLLGQFERAIDDLTQAIDIEPEYAVAFYTRALAFTQLGKHAEAGEDVEQAVKFGLEQNSIDAAIEELIDSPEVSSEDSP